MRKVKFHRTTTVTKYYGRNFEVEEEKVIDVFGSVDNFNKYLDGEPLPSDIENKFDENYGGSLMNFEDECEELGLVYEGEGKYDDEEHGSGHLNENGVVLSD
jgi:hypothetical protein